MSPQSRAYKNRMYQIECNLVDILQIDSDNA